MNGPAFIGAADEQPRAQVVPRATIETIVKHRNRALELYADAYDRMHTAADAVNAANTQARNATFGETRYNVHNHEAKAKPVLLGNDLPPRDEYLKAQRRIVDTDVWSYVIKISELETVMDKTAKDEMHQALLNDPPEATVENIAATLQQFILDADTIFRRGIAKCFSDLDRRFRSHDGWKIGSRVILSYAFNEWGSWNWNRNHEDTLRDIERTFLTLDETGVPQYGGIVDLVSRSRNGGSGRRQSEYENDYFLIRGYKNGNCHVWFKRDDLLEKVNKLLGEYYNAPIPEDREPDIFTGLNDPKTTLAKHYGFFPTPDAAADTLVDKVPLYVEKGKPPLTILEPSAGTGQLAKLCAKPRSGIDGDWNSRTEYTYRHHVDCVEFQAPLARDLKAQRIYRKIFNVDFLTLKPETTGLYDRVVMNPPFDRERDIDHVMHALKFLKPDGFLAAIMSAGTEFRETRKSKAFRELMQKMKARWADLPPGSFSSVGTNCNTLILTVYKDGRSFY